MNDFNAAMDAIEKHAQLAYLCNGEELSEKIRDKKVYLSGPITGVKNYKGLFLFTSKLARMCDTSQVFDPASQIPDSLGYEEAMKRCIRALTDHDTIVMLPDWNVSQGSKVEHEVARACGMDVVYLASYAVVIDRYNFMKNELARLL